MNFELDVWETLEMLSCVGLVLLSVSKKDWHREQISFRNIPGDSLLAHHTANTVAQYTYIHYITLQYWVVKREYKIVVQNNAVYTATKFSTQTFTRKETKHLNITFYDSFH